MQRAWPIVVVVVGALSSSAAAADQVHLGIPGPDPSTELSVLWLEPAPLSEAAVTLTTPQGERRITAQLVPGPSAGFAYEARLDDLVAGEVYEYSIGAEAFELVTPPTALTEGDVVTFAATGDMGVRDQSRTTAETIAQLEVDLVLHAGDISYAQGDPAAWAAWFDMVEPVASRVPWVTALGNHETYSGPVGTPYNAPSPAEVGFYTQRFGLPNNELWYSFDWAGIHIIGLDTYSSYLSGPDPDEIAWLEQDLAASDALWTVAFLHEPPYSSNSHGSSERVQAAFVALFEEHGVDLVIAAHDHGYERSHQLLGGNVVDDDGAFAEGAGVVYLVTGGGGQSLYDEWSDEPDWSAARGAFYHVTHCAATLTSLGCRVVPTEDDAIEDSFTINRLAEQDAAVGDGGADESPGVGFLIALAAVLVAALVSRTGRSRP